MKKLIALVCVIFPVAAMLGCGLNEAGTVKVTIDSIDTVARGDSGWVYGTIESDSTITNVTMAIKDSVGTVLNTTVISANFLPSSYLNRDSVDLFMDMQTMIHANASAAPGIDTLVITVASGVIKRKASHPFVVM
jgi:hypothetical protein